MEALGRAELLDDAACATLRRRRLVVVDSAVPADVVAKDSKR